jgi:hypothetical protein
MSVVQESYHNEQNIGWTYSKHQRIYKPARARVPKI